MHKKWSYCKYLKFQYILGCLLYYCLCGVIKSRRAVGHFPMEFEMGRGRDMEYKF